MPRAQISLLLSQATSLPAPWTHIGVSELQTAPMGTKPRSAAKTGLLAKGSVNPGEDDHPITPGTETCCSDSSGCLPLASDAQGSQVGKSCCPGNTASHLNISLERGVPWGSVPVPGRSSSAGLGQGAQEGLQTPTAGGCQAMPYLWGQHQCHSGHPGSQLGPPSSSSSGSRWSLVGPAAPCPGGAKPGAVECVPMAQDPPSEHPWGRQCHSQFTRVQQLPAPRAPSHTTSAPQCPLGTPTAPTFSSAVSAKCRRRDVMLTRLCSKAATRLAWER